MGPHFNVAKHRIKNTNTKGLFQLFFSVQQYKMCVVTNAVTNKGHSRSENTKNKDRAETLEILEIDFYSTLSFNFHPTKLFIWKHSVWEKKKKSGDCGLKIIKEKNMH